MRLIAMTFEQIITIAERIGIPTVALLLLFWFTVRFAWPFITEKAWPFLVGLVESGRKERIEERDKFLGAIQRLVDERDAERDAFIASMAERDNKLTGTRDVFLEHLAQRDEKFQPVVEALRGLVGSVAELHKMAQGISASLVMVQKQLDDLIKKQVA